METAGAIIFLPRDGNRKTLMLEELLFDPAAFWLERALEQAGVDRFLVVCHQDDREEAAACFPEGTEFITTGTEDASERLGAFLKARAGRVIVVTRPVQILCGQARLLMADSTTGPLDDKETGVCRIDAGALAAALDEGVPIESALRARADKLNGRSVWFQGARVLRGDWSSRVEAELLARNESAVRLMEAGVRILDPNSVYIGLRVIVGEGTVLLPGTILRGNTTIGSGCALGPNTVIQDATIGDQVVINASQVYESNVQSNAQVGPFAYLRANCQVGCDVEISNFVELKNVTVGDGTRVGPHSYIGDCDVGDGVSLGSGTVTVNYDGITQYRTAIGDYAFIGCNTNLVAPLQIGERAYTAAGSTITDDVPADSLAIARSQQTVKKQWAAKRRNRRK